MIISVRRYLPQDRGGTAVEYALLAALIAAVVAGIVAQVGQQVLDLFQTLDGSF